jgi:glycosyltransferase involved in cell wall biosynthesis
MPTISAIVCVGREIRWLQEALASIRSQSRPVDETLLVVSDDTPAALGECVRAFAIDRIQKQDRPGLAAARNLGVDRASGDLVTFLDTDDRWLQDKTALQERQIQAGAPGVVGQLLRFADSSCDASDYPAGFFGRKHPAMTPGGLMIPRAAFARVGAFDERYRLACDHEWFIRARRTGLGLQVIGEVVLEKRIHPGSLSRATAAYRRELTEVLRRTPRGAEFPVGRQRD